MEFRLPLPPFKNDFLISHSDHLLLMGSCFTENMGHELVRSGFTTCLNPLGVLYNPISIFQSLINSIHKKTYLSSDLDKREDLFFSFDHHGSFSDISEQRCLEKINAALSASHRFINHASHFFLTLGSSYVYELKDTGRLVANCHKLPAAVFNKRLLQKEEIIQHFDKMYVQLPIGKKIIFTVSPVRHWRDGAVENSRSKAILLTAVHEIVELYPDCYYFPAYELVLDDLRDYRFYERDMLHPNELAVSYLWERFKSAYFSSSTCSVIEELRSLRQAMEHRPLFPNSCSHQKFLIELEARKKSFIEKNPSILF